VSSKENPLLLSVVLWWCFFCRDISFVVNSLYSVNIFFCVSSKSGRIRRKKVEMKIEKAEKSSKEIAEKVTWISLF
jgi:hypothetical protein